MDTGDRVLCHACGRVWPRNQYESLECPHCSSEFTEIVEIPPDTDPEPEPSPLPTTHPDPPESFPGQRSPSPFHADPLGGHNPWTQTDDDDTHGWSSPGYHYTHRTFQTPGGNIRYSFQARSLPQRGSPLRGVGRGPRDPSRDPHDPYGFQPFDAMFGGLSDLQRERAARARGPSSPPRHPFEDFYGTGNRGTFQGHYTPRAGLFPRDAEGPQPMGSPLRSLTDILDLFQSNLGNLQASQPGQAGGAGPGGPGGLGGPGGTTRGMPIGQLFQILMNISHNGDAVYSQEELDRVVSQLVEQNGNRSTVPPASEDAIHNLPKKPADAQMLGGEAGAECSICMDAVKIGDEVTVLPCTHWFHPQCIEMWLSQHNTCPHCRRGIEPTTAPEATTAPSEGTSEQTRRSESPRSSGHPSFVSDEEQTPSRRRTRGESSASGGWTGWVRSRFGAGS